MRPTHRDDLQSEFRNSKSEIRHHSHDGNDSTNATAKQNARQRNKEQIMNNGLTARATARLSGIKISARFAITMIAVAAILVTSLLASTRSSRASSVYSTIRSWVTTSPQQKRNAPLAGEVTLTATAGTATGTFTTLKGAFDAINAGTHQGLIAISINANTTEAASAALNASGAGSASYTSISIQPAGGAARTISGAIAGHLIDLNGADNVTIDGLNSGGNSLTIENTLSAATPTAIRFIGDATSNTVQNCTIKSAETSTTLGTIFFSTGAAAGTGNDGNLITGNTITSSGANFATNAIYSLGTSAAIDNSGNTVSSNNVSDYFNAASGTNGILLGATGNSGWTISSNKLFQTATRIYTTGNTHNGISVLVGSGYTINSNTIGFANTGGTGTTNIVGNSVALTGTFPTSYTTTGTANTTRYIAINAAFTAAGTVSNIQGNTVAGIALYSSSGAATTNGILCGINLTSGNANIGTTTGNTIGATTGQSSLYSVSNGGTGAAVGIFATSTNTVTIQNNTIGGIDAVGVTSSQSGSFNGIDTAGTAGVFNISSNFIGNTTADNIRIGFTQTAGSLSNTGTLVSTTGTTGVMAGVRNSGTGALTMNSNTLRGWANGTTSTGAVVGVTSTGANTTSVAINSNLLGTSALGWIRYAFANTGTLTGINATGPAAAATLSISTNDFRGIVHSAAGTTAHTYATWSHANSVADSINGNTFTNLNVNTAGSVTFLNRGTLNMTATGSLSVSSNQIVTGFNKGTAGGTVTFFTNGGGSSSLNGSTILHNLNNFSNVTLTGATAVLCLSDADGPGGGVGPTKTITNNTFNTITTGAAQITGITHNFSGNGSTVTGNTLSNLTSGGVILAISTGASISGTTGTISSNTLTNFTAGGQVNALQTAFASALSTGNINNNTITGISSSGAANTVFGIIDSGFGVTTNVFKNKIGNIQSDNAGASVFGILAQTAGTTHNIFNNLIGDLRTPSSTAAASNQLQGISIGTGLTTANVYYNTVWLNSTNTGAVFGSSALFANTTPTVVMQNNILVNKSVTNGGALTVAYRRSSTTLTTYGAASNNNDFYAGTPGATNLIFNDGTNSDQTITAYKTRVASRDSASFSEDPTTKFLSTTASSATFLHMNTTIATQIESGGTAVAGITDDFDGDTRSVSTPDVGADEFSGIGIDLIAPVITYTTFANTTQTANRILTVTITDATGVAQGALSPRIYFKRSTDGSYVSTQCTLASGNAQNGTYTCTIDYSLLTPPSVTTGDVVQYFVVAQDTAGTPNVGANPSAGFSATSVNSVTTPPTPPNSYTIVAAFPSSVTVGSGGTYPSLTNTGGLFEAMNAGTFTGSTTVTIISNLSGELGTVALNQLTEEGVGAGTFTVTIKPTNPNTTITGDSTAAAVRALIRLNGADRVTIDGSTSGGTDRNLTITNNDAATSANAVILVSSGTSGAQTDVIKNVVVVGSANTQTFFGIGFGGATVSSLGTDNDNNRVENCDIRKVQYGVATQGASVANKDAGTVITQNLMNNTGANSIGRGAIIASFEDGIQITQNTIGGIVFNGTGDVFGVTLGGLIGWSNTTTSGALEVSNATVTRNNIGTVQQTNTYAAAGIIVGPATTGTNLVANNFVSGVLTNGTTGDFGAGIFIIESGTDSTTQLYYNSVSMTGTLTSGSEHQFALAVNGTDPLMDVRDNIFFNTQSTGTSNNSYAIGLGYSTFVNLTSNYNDLFVTTTGNFRVGRTGSLTTAGGTDQTTLANWQAAPPTGTGKDANSKSGTAPGFTSTTDLHINPATAAQSPVNNAGTPIATVTVDFDNEPRSATTPDIGADEFVVNFSSSGNATLPAGNYDSITVNNGDVVTLSGNITVNSFVLINSGGTLNMAAFTISGTATFTLSSGGILGIGSAAGISSTPATGNVQVTGARSYSSGATYVYNGSVNQAVGNELPATVANLTIANTGPGGNNTVTGNAGQAVTGLLRVQSGIYSSASDYANVQIDVGGTLSLAANITVSGNWTNNGTFNANGFGVTFDGTTSQSISGSSTTPFGNLTISNPGGNVVSLAADITISGNFALTSGAEFDSTTRSVSLSGNYNNTSGIYSSAVPGLLTFTGSTTLTSNTANNYFPAVTIGPGSSLNQVDHIRVHGNWLDNATVGGASGHSGTGVTQFIPDGAVTRTIGGSVAVPKFAYVIITTSNGAVSQAAKGLDIDGFVQISQGTFDDGGFNHTVGGDWLKAGGTIFTASGTITFDGAAAANVQASNFNNLTVNKSTQPTVVTQTGSITVTGNLTVTTGTFDQGAASNLTAAAISVGAGATLRNLGTGDLTLAGNVANSGTITYNANGTSCGDADDILIRSSVGGTQRTWSGTGTFNMTDVDVQDQRTPVVPPPVAIIVTNGTDSGNNIGWVFSGTCPAATYTWTGTVNSDWQVAGNWSPARAVPAAGDILVLDGTATPGPIITNVPTQTIAALRLINGVSATLNASAVLPPQTLTVSGATGTDLTVPALNQLTLAGTDGLTINVASGSTATIGGLFLMQDGAHRLIGNAANAITFQSGSICTTAPSYTSSVNPFGSGGGGVNGTTGSVIFQSGSNYFHNNGESPFGALVSPAIAIFQTGSTANWLSSNGFQGRTYSNLVIGNPSTATVVSSSGTDPFEFDSLTVNSTGAANSSLTFSDGGVVNIKGDITSTGVGNGAVVPDVTLLSSTNIVIAKTPNGTINFNNSGGSTRTVKFGNATAGSGNATVNTGNTLALARNLVVDINSVITVNGALSGSATGYVIGNEKRPFEETGLFIFHVGTPNGYSPLDANVTGIIGTSALTVRANEGAQPVLMSATSLQRHWTLTEGGDITADLTFHYNQTDVSGSEPNYRLVIVEAGNATSFPESCPDVACVNEAANTIRRTGVETFSDWTAAEPNAPTSVKLSGFSAVRAGDDVMLRWQSGFEARNLGYNIYREQDGQRVQITPSLVAGSALIAGRQTKLTAGLNYSWVDSNQQSAVSKQQTVYWLEDVDLNGTRTMHGPIAATECESADCQQLSERSPSFAEVDAQVGNSRSSSNSGGVEFTSGPAAVTDSDIGIVPVDDDGGDPNAMQQTIAGMPAIKISISRAGWYRLTQPQVVAAGLNYGDAKKLQLYRNGRQIPYRLSNTVDEWGASDYLEFYGEGISSTTAKAQTYYLVQLDTRGKRVRVTDKIVALGDPAGPQNFAYTVERKERMVYFSGLLNGDNENFFGQILTSSPTTATIPVSAREPADGAQLEVVLQGVSNQSHVVQVRLNGTDLGTVNFASTDHHNQTFNVPAAALQDGNNSVELTALGGATDVSLVDVLRLTYARQYAAENNALIFSINSQQTKRITGFSGEKIRVVDVTDPHNPLELNPVVAPDGGGFAADIQARASANRPHTLVAFLENQAATADGFALNEPSSWRSEGEGADYLIITTRSLMASVEPLAQLRRNQGMVVKVVDVEDLYDEFSFGEHAPRVMHDFLQGASTAWTRQPHYVLFAGDASYDPKNYFGQGLKDLVPTKLIDTALSETASDDWLADFNNDGMADLSLGRLPVKTAAETDAMVGKIVSYENMTPDPSRGALLVADTNFEAPSSVVQSLLPSGMTVTAVNRSSADDATIHNQIVAGINQGPRVTNYIGHGSNGVWTGASLLSNNDAPTLTNTNRLSVFTMMTCFNGYFQDAYNDSLSEALLKAPGGAVAVWASTTLTEPSGQNAIDQEFYRLLFGAQPATLGDAARAAKAVTTDADVRRTWTLFGDPALRLR